jgi:hypothetical protein
MDALGKLEMCSLDQFEVCKIAVNDERHEAWVGLGTFAGVVAPGDWVKRNRHWFDVFDNRVAHPDGIIVGRRVHEGLGDHDPTPFLILWFR